jgi:uncharacterized protein YigA (DUF484 family)
VGWLAKARRYSHWRSSVDVTGLAASNDATVSGLLVLASPDAEQFQAGMGVDFLVQLASWPARR